MTSDYITCHEKKIYFQYGADLSERRLLLQPNFKDYWGLAGSLLLWDSDISIALSFQREELGMAPGNSVASIWLLFVKKLRSMAEWFPALIMNKCTLYENLI